MDLSDGMMWRAVMCGFHNVHHESSTIDLVGPCLVTDQLIVPCIVNNYLVELPVVSSHIGLQSQMWMILLVTTNIQM